MIVQNRCKAFVTALWCITAICLHPLGAAELVRDGKPVATIVLPAVTEWNRYVDATPAELEAFARARFPHATPEQLAAVLKKLPSQRAKEAKRAGDDEVLAAEELVAIVQAISGATLPVVRLEAGQDLPAGTLVLLGAELATQAGLATELAALGPHGFIVRSTEDRVIVSGRHARGTLYGVYELLESFGCRWVMPGPFGEIYPELPTVTATLNTTQSPSHPLHRYWWCTFGEGDGYVEWTLRNKGSFKLALGQSKVRQQHISNTVLAWGAKGELGQVGVEMVKDYKRDADGKIIRGRDGRPLEEIMVEKEVRRLPDAYYAQEAGEPNLHFANFVNPDAWRLYADYYIETFYNNPLWDYESISAADGLIVDDRQAVRNLDSGEWDWTQGAPVVTDRMWFFHNRYLDMVAEVHPDRKYGILVYANNMAPPRVETVHPNMALVLAPLSICPLHHVRDDKCKSNRAYREWLPSWFAQAGAVGAESYYYDYFPIGFSWSNFMIAPQWQIIGRNYPWFHEMGMTGHTTQGFDDWGAMGLTNWVAIRLYWDATLDYNDLVREWCDLRFGPAAGKAMHAYYRVFEARMDEIPDLCGNEIWGTHLAIDAATRAAARAKLDAAAPLIQGERAQDQYAAAVLYQDAMEAWGDGIDHSRETGDFAAAAQIMSRAFEIRDELNKLYSHFINPRQTGTDPTQVHNLRRYRPGGFYNKHRLWGDIVAKSAVSQVLPREMHVVLDTANVAWTKGLQNPGADVSDLEIWDVTQVPDIKYQTQREPAAFFYRTELAVSADFAGKESVQLFFPSLIARAVQIWVNGEPVRFEVDGYESTTWRGPAVFWSNYNHSRIFDVTGLIKPGETNTIAFRTFKSYDHGGTYDRVFLLADPPPIR